MQPGTNLASTPLHCIHSNLRTNRVRRSKFTKKQVYDAVKVSYFGKTARVERDEMEKFYKNHRIEVSLSLEDEGWFVNLFIYYTEKNTNILVTFSLDRKLTTYDGAVEAGLSAAQEWIDRGKPARP